MNTEQRDKEYWLFNVNYKKNPVIWEQCRKSGFLAMHYEPETDRAAEIKRNKDTIKKISLGDCVIAYCSDKGFLGMGTVTKEFYEVNDKKLFINSGEGEKYRQRVGVEWLISLNEPIYYTGEGFQKNLGLENVIMSADTIFKLSIKGYEFVNQLFYANGLAEGVNPKYWFAVHDKASYDFNPNVLGFDYSTHRAKDIKKRDKVVYYISGSNNGIKGIYEVVDISTNNKFEKQWDADIQILLKPEMIGKSTADIRTLVDDLNLFKGTTAWQTKIRGTNAVRNLDSHDFELIEKHISSISKDWTKEENELIIADYFSMLTKEIMGEDYSKTEHRLTLQQKLNNRSKGSIEFKHQNISAVLYDNNYHYIQGYKPRGNYQGILEEMVLTQ